MVKYNNYNLKHLNSFRLNSIGKTVYFPTDIKNLRNIFIFHPNAKILAGGTNVVLSPSINEVICLTNMPATLLYLPILYPNKITVEANYSTHKFCTYMNTISGGFETLFGIPGTVGGAVVMNAGAMGHTISEHLLSVKVLTPQGQIQTYTKSQLKFKRRYSILQDKNVILLTATFKIPHIPLDETLLKQSQDNRKALPKYPSAGGFFINWHDLKPHKDKLIGIRIGDIEVSESVNIIVNKGEGKFEDILSVITKIQKIVKNKLYPEVKFL
jgi:UDP-N-acetylmuramate dehydrogenase